MTQKTKFKIGFDMDEDDIKIGTYSYTLDEQIAMILDFIPCHNHLINGKPQWTYPDDWSQYDSVRPQLRVPKFVEMIKASRKFYETF